MPHEFEPSGLPRLPADMREPEELERLVGGLPFSTRLLARILQAPRLMRARIRHEAGPSPRMARHSSGRDSRCLTREFSDGGSARASSRTTFVATSRSGLRGSCMGWSRWAGHRPWMAVDDGRHGSVGWMPSEALLGLPAGFGWRVSWRSRGRLARLELGPATYPGGFADRARSTN
jgi:hypothetical protein